MSMRFLQSNKDCRLVADGTTVWNPWLCAPFDKQRNSLFFSVLLSGVILIGTGRTFGSLSQPKVLEQGAQCNCITFGGLRFLPSSTASCRLAKACREGDQATYCELELALVVSLAYSQGFQYDMEMATAKRPLSLLRFQGDPIS